MSTDLVRLKTRYDENGDLEFKIDTIAWRITKSSLDAAENKDQFFAHNVIHIGTRLAHAILDYTINGKIKIPVVTPTEQRSSGDNPQSNS